MELELEDLGSNPTDNRPFDDILTARIARRSVLGGGLALAATTFLLGRDVRFAAARQPAATAAAAAFEFRPVPLGFGNTVVVPDGYEVTTLLPWGTPIMRAAGTGLYPANHIQQERRIGLGHDGMHFFPTGSGRGVLCMNQEFGTNDHIANGTGRRPGNAAFVKLSQAAHGVAVVELEKRGGTWQVVMGRKNRRITPNTPVTFSGPAAGSALLANPANNAPQGTVNNCASGFTPWGTYLTCEENFNGYFGWPESTDYGVTEAQARYGFRQGGFGYGWHDFDPRFNLADPTYANEHNRFGWVVEIDPNDPDAKPVKRTALGRFKHENAEVVEGKGGRIVVYMGDDERFDYVYKFVSNKTATGASMANSPLDDGTLYVAKFEDETGVWMPLTLGNVNPKRKAQGKREFVDMADLLVNTRLAADALGATQMDRPEWAAANPLTGEIFIAMTNNTRREESDDPGTERIDEGTNAANPRANNRYGHIVKIVDGDEHVGTTFEWDIFVLAGPVGEDGSTTTADGAHGSPDGLAFDENGMMYILTDGRQPGGANDQMLLADPHTGVIKRFLTGVTDCEVTGWTKLDNESFMVNLQHPGDGDPAVTSWPADDSTGLTPRDACVIVTKVGDGGAS